MARHPVRWHDRPGDERFGVVVMVIACSILSVLLLGALIAGRLRDLASDTPTSLHP